jgi:hypothetical protein
MMRMIYATISCVVHNERKHHALVSAPFLFPDLSVIYQGRVLRGLTEPGC